MDSNKVPFSFPVVFHGLLSHSEEYNNEAVFNIIMDGSPDPIGAKDPTPRGKVINGKEPIMPKWVKEYYEAGSSERSRRVRALKISFPGQTVSAFHTYLHSDGCEVQIHPHQLKKLDRVLIESKDPYDYIQIAFEMTLKPSQRQWDDIRPSLNAIKDKLHNLPEIIQTEDLFESQDDGHLLSLVPDQNKEALAAAWMPWITKAFFSALFPSIEIDAAYFQRGDIQGFIDSLMERHQLTEWEYYKWINRRIPIIELASVCLQSENDCNLGEEQQTPTTIDWLIDFFEKAGDISDEDVQLLWAKVLAGEIKHPGSFSQKTLRILLDLEPYQANEFEALTKILITNTLEPGENPFVFDTSRLKTDVNRCYLFERNMLDLVDAGLLMPKTTGEIREFGFTFKPIEPLKVLLTNRYEQIALCFFEKEESQSEKPVIEKYELTSSGLELLQIFYQPDNEYLLLLGAALAGEADFPYSVHVYKVTEEAFRIEDLVVPAGEEMLRYYRYETAGYDYLDTNHNLISEFPLKERLKAIKDLHHSMHIDLRGID